MEVFTKEYLQLLAAEVSQYIPAPTPVPPTIPRMRTIAAAIKQIHQEDPESEVTENHIKQLVLNGEIPYVSAGKKKLINYDTLIAYLYSQHEDKQEEQKETGIRPIY